ncbi:FoF1 ATP synthase subunit delta/epsilon [Candidatus Margulisiibacteriota bacterium]
MKSESDKFVLKVITPGGTELSQEAEFVRVAGFDGDVGILKDHSPAFLELVPGKLLVWFSREVKERYFVPGGFAQILQGEVVILTEYLEKIKDLDITVAEAEALHAQKVLEEKEKIKEIDRKQALRCLLRARAKIHHYNRLNT